MTGQGTSAIKVGVIADQTGALSFMGIADANVAEMVVNDINADGGLLGRPVDLYLQDGATTDSVAEAAATKLVQDHHVDVIFGGIYSSTGKLLRAQPSRRGRSFTSTLSNTRGRNATLSSFVPAPCQRNRLSPSSRG